MKTIGITLTFLWSALPGGADPVDDLVSTYTKAVRQVNEAHARRAGKTREADLAKRLPAKARTALEGLLKSPDSPRLADGIVACAEAALDLDLVEDFARLRSRIEKLSPERAAALGIALSRPRFLLRGIGVSAEYLSSVAEVLEAILAAYDELFGFEEWSKVPGKKLRVRVHREESPAPPHFAPQFPFHSEIDFPLRDGSAFRSPTAAGEFLFYGLCHELGHVIAMWGDMKREEDHHQWAHYTGVAIVEHLSETAKDRAVLQGLRDVRWRSLSAERKRLDGRAPSLADKEGVLALLIALHDKLGPKAIGEALNLLDRQDRRLRVNRVRYYTFKELKQALLLVRKKAEERKAIAEIIPDGPAR